MEYASTFIVRWRKLFPIRSLGQSGVTQRCEENLGESQWRKALILHFRGEEKLLVMHLLFQSAKHFACPRSLSFLCSDHRSSNMAPSDSDRDCASRRDSDPQHHHRGPPMPRLGVSAAHHPDSESGGSHSPSPRASRKRSKIKNHSLTSLCIISHHPFFSTFRECLFILKKLIDACNESASPRRVGASKQLGRYEVKRKIR